MTSLLFGISTAALLSLTSLLVILFRASPLTAPLYAITAFLGSVFLTVATVGTLLLYAIWKWLPFHTWDTGKLLSISLRQGILLAIAITLMFLFLSLQILTWWVGGMIIGVFLLVELAINA